MWFFGPELAGDRNGSPWNCRGSAESSLGSACSARLARQLRSASATRRHRYAPRAAQKRGRKCTLLCAAPEPTSGAASLLYSDSMQQRAVLGELAETARERGGAGDRRPRCFARKTADPGRQHHEPLWSGSNEHRVPSKHVGKARHKQIHANSNNNQQQVRQRWS